MSHLNKKVLGAGAAMVALSAFVPNPFLIGEAMAQATAQDTMNITAKVVNPLKVSQITKLNFGSFAVSKSAGKLTVPANGAPAISKGVIIGAAVDGKVSFNAPKNATFTIEISTLAAASIVLKNGAGGSSKLTMKVDQIFLKVTATTKMKISGGGAQVTFAKGGNTDATAKIVTGTKAAADVGGRLNFKPTQATGTYQGTYDLVITF